jgi:hypothetical protein
MRIGRVPTKQKSPALRLDSTCHGRVPRRSLSFFLTLWWTPGSTFPSSAWGLFSGRVVLGTALIPL